MCYCVCIRHVVLISNDVAAANNVLWVNKLKKDIHTLVLLPYVVFCMLIYNVMILFQPVESIKILYGVK